MRTMYKVNALASSLEFQALTLAATKAAGTLCLFNGDRAVYTGASRVFPAYTVTPATIKYEIQLLSGRHKGYTDFILAPAPQALAWLTGGGS